MKKLLILTIIVVFAFVGLRAGDYKDGLYAEINTTKGLIVVKLEFEKVPLTVSNFVGLAEGTIKNTAKKPGEPYFDGIVFHRVIADFMIQSGDPTGTGAGGPGYTFPDEFHATLRHDKGGILSMANRGPNTNGSQIFITHKATPWLDNKHAVFGETVKGMDVVNSISKGDKIKSVKIVRVGEKAKKFKPDNDSFNKLIEKADQ
jgi:peptidylprolyl isomerase